MLVLFEHSHQDNNDHFFVYLCPEWIVCSASLNSFLRGLENTTSSVMIRCLSVGPKLLVLMVCQFGGWAVCLDLAVCMVVVLMKHDD